MSTKIIFGSFYGTIRNYFAKDGLHWFVFELVNRGDYFDIYCTWHPTLNGKDPNPHKTHLYKSGKICFVEGKEPRSFEKAERRAKEWAEYYLEYRKTGVAQH